MVLPEISSCLAGACKMSFKRFLFAWFLGNLIKSRSYPTFINDDVLLFSFELI